MNLEGKIIDLSQEIYTGMPVYPGHLKTVIFTHVSHEETERMFTQLKNSKKLVGQLKESVEDISSGKEE